MDDKGWLWVSLLRERVGVGRVQPSSRIQHCAIIRTLSANSTRLLDPEIDCLKGVGLLVKGPMFEDVLGDFAKG